MKPLKPDLEWTAQDETCCLVYPEEKLVDYVMNGLTSTERVNLELHLEVCDICSVRVTEWTKVLEPDARMDDQESTTYFHASEDCKPSKRVRRRLMCAAYARSFQSRFQVSKPVVLRTLVGVMFIGLIVGLMSLQEPDRQTVGAFEHTLNQRIADMQGEGTERYAIQPLEPFFGSGSVWIKRQSGEMLIVVNGLHALEETDYQVWLQEEDLLSSAGLMHVQELLGKSYYYGFGAENAKRIVVSMEPKGGSRRPTGIEAVLVNMEP